MGQAGSSHSGVGKIIARERDHSLPNPSLKRARTDMTLQRMDHVLIVVDNLVPGG